MTATQTEVDGREYPVIHYKFGIFQPGVKISKEHDVYFADIRGIKYVLGCSFIDGDPNVIAEILDSAMLTQTTTEEDDGQ
jgi:hypothetical protein